MDPTIPNIEASIFDDNLSSEAVSNTSAPNRLQDVESRESKSGPSVGGNPQDDNSDDARAQVAAVVQQNDDGHLADDVSGSIVPGATQSADDDDVLPADSVFVDKVKEVISSTNSDPEKRSDGIARVQAEFILSRFNHQIRLSRETDE
jgi:hypothetical protein